MRLSEKRYLHHCLFRSEKNQRKTVSQTVSSFTRDEWNHLLCLFNIVNFSMYSCSHFSGFLSDDPIGKQSAMSSRSQKTTSNERSPTAKAKPCLVLREREQRREEISSQSLGYRVNPGYADERKRSRKSNQATGAPRLKFRNRTPSTSRQENSLRGCRKLVREDQLQTDSDERKHSNSNSTRKLAASSPELRNMEHTTHQCMSEIFQFLQKRLGMSARDATFS